MSKRSNVSSGQPENTLLSPLLAWVLADQVVCRHGQEGRHRLASGTGVMLDADDASGRHERLIAPFLLQDNASPDARILPALPLDIESLMQACPELLQQPSTIEWDETQGTLRASCRSHTGQFTVEVQLLVKPSEEELYRVTLNDICDKGLGVLNWASEAGQFRLRLQCAASWPSKYDWPAVDKKSLLATLENWLLPHMSGVYSLRVLEALNMGLMLRGLPNWSMPQHLDSELPAHYIVPTGSRIVIRYHEDDPPVLAVRMQGMFGEAKTPAIAQGRVPLVLELLPLVRRPLQVTSDPNALWQRSYREV